MIVTTCQDFIIGFLLKKGGLGVETLDRAANGVSRISVVPGRELSTGYPQLTTISY
jgi:hypothetical protein